MKSNQDCGAKEKVGLDGYTITKRSNHTRPNGANTLKVTFDFREVGFARDTLVRVRDLFAQEDLGIFTQQYSVAVPLHGAQMLRLEYEPKYRTNHTEL